MPPFLLSLHLGKDAPKAPSMHIKPKDPKSFVTPAPGAYNPESADKDVKSMAPKYSFGIKGKDEKPKDVPGTYIYYICDTSTTYIQNQYYYRSN